MWECSVGEMSSLCAICPETPLTKRLATLACFGMLKHLTRVVQYCNWSKLAQTAHGLETSTLWAAATKIVHTVIVTNTAANTRANEDTEVMLPPGDSLWGLTLPGGERP